MRKIFVAFMMLMMLLFVTGCGTSKTEKLVVGIDDDFPPISFRDTQGELIGFDIELAREAAKRLGVEFEFRPIDWDNKREELTSGNVDMIWDGLDITDERKEYMLFSKPYMDDRQILLVKAGDTQGIGVEEDLEGKIVGTQAGSTSECYLSGKETLRNSFKGYKTYAKFTETVDALKRGDIDVVVCDEIVARYEMNTNPDQLEIVNVKIGDLTETGIGFRKDSVALRDRVQKVFDEMIRDGTAKKISEQWFQADLIKQVR
ncbi:MAG: amino acid ABC transporter substrate-binding protein [Quinella sp. 1Q7]|nr:amino acid ABC transporter substrate-binding protein [Quinella sp. 1Q7]